MKNENDKILFLPGTLCDETLWSEQISNFKNATVVSLRSQCSLEDMLQSVYAATSESKVILIGFSMGGYVAQEFAIKYPNKISKCVLIGSSLEGYPEKEKQIVLKFLPMIERGEFKGINDKRLKSYLYIDAYEKEEIRKKIQSMAGDDAGKVYSNQLKATLHRRNLIDEFSHIPLPILFIAGENDEIISVDSIRRSSQSTLNAKFISLKKCGHFVPLEKPKELNEILLKFCLN